jgi:imidazolonepropionase-like amidohydrolase
VSVRRALVHGRVFDSTAGALVDGLAVLIEGDRIEAVVAARDLAASVERIELAGEVVMPGLIDCHAHFALWSLDLLSHSGSTVEALRDGTRRALRDALEAGCVAVRDPGGLEPAFRDAVRDGAIRGPRLQTSITIVSPPHGITDSTWRHGVRAPVLAGMPGPECSGPDGARAKVREVIAAGADFIKLASTGGVSSPNLEPRQRLFSDAELQAIVDEAHAAGRRVACHALGGPGVLAAIRAGVDSIEHGVWLDDAAIDEMAARGTWYVPTLAAYELHRRQGPPLQRTRAEAMVPAHRDSVRRARSAGVRIACGSDGGVYGHDLVLELELLVQAGLSPAEALVAATAGAAACLGWEDSLGSVVAGRRADLLVVNGDPSQDVSVLRAAGTLRVMVAGSFLDGV